MKNRITINTGPLILLLGISILSIAVGITAESKVGEGSGLFTALGVWIFFGGIEGMFFVFSPDKSVLRSSKKQNNKTTSEPGNGEVREKP